MNQKEKIFDECMISEGGIYLPTGANEHDDLYLTMLAEVTQFIEQIRVMNPKLPKVNIYYVDNEHVINACAFKSDSEYFIAINTAAVIELKRVYDMIFESDKLYDGEFVNKSEQHAYSNKFLYFSLMFLAVHEYSHIRYGHCDLIYNLWGRSITELTSNCLIDDGIFRQTLELDADCCTIANITNRVLMINNRDINKISEELGQWMLSCYILFKIFDDGRHSMYQDYDLDSLAQSTHPRPGIRQNYLIANISTVLLKHLKYSEADTIIGKILSYIVKFEETLNDIVVLRNLELGVSYTIKGNEHLKRISNNWETVRIMLEPYTHDELAPSKAVNFTPEFID
ncbi:hypothetical protein COJ07_10210 [Bacillus cereus]|uniref:hypothetical protein n=1 Tax=Bacillus cereus TaxID=1396 RepID=UPI000BF64E92|nr:hypothetical protein [Bacillus cereus]PFL21652.1 hypothetical protein COJ07_10210 [Bacillus cereus]